MVMTPVLLSVNYGVASWALMLSKIVLT